MSEAKMKFDVEKILEEAQRLEKRAKPIASDDKKEQFVKDFCNWFPRQSFSDDQAERIYRVVANKVRQATCGQCLRLKPRSGGVLSHPNGDLSKPKVFVCEDCK